MCVANTPPQSRVTCGAPVCAPESFLMFEADAQHYIPHPPYPLPAYLTYCLTSYLTNYYPSLPPTNYLTHLTTFFLTAFPQKLCLQARDAGCWLKIK